MKVNVTPRRTHTHRDLGIRIIYREREREKEDVLKRMINSSHTALKKNSIATRCNT